MTIREALLAMGYQERFPQKWLKPIGFQCFSYDETRNEWSNWFLDTENVISLWESGSFELDQERGGCFLKQLKNMECWTRCGIHVHGHSHFEMNIPDL